MDERELPDFPPQVFADRRARALAALGTGAMVLTGGASRFRRGDDESPYRPDSELFYLTGVTEPGAVAVLRGFADEDRFVLFVRPNDPEAELWTGKRLGPDASKERFGPEACHPLTDLDEQLPGLLHGADAVHFRLDSDEWAEGLVRSALTHGRTRGMRTGTGPRGIVDPGEILNDMRLRKDSLEQAALRRAADLSVAGHRALTRELREGVGEWELEAVIDGAFRRGGGEGPAYDSIIASGANACVLHYKANHRRVGAGDAVLVDAAAELGHYCADITRTYPAAGGFSAEQRSVYDIVDRAREAAVAGTAPGVTLDALHEKALRIIAEGLLELGVVSGAPEDIIEEKTYREYFPHRTSHWLGLDVHDPGDYAVAGAPTVLTEGMVFTVEPGLYFAPDGSAGSSPFAGVGVRIEDDVLVTADGYENLTGSLPSRLEIVEDLIAR